MTLDTPAVVFELYCHVPLLFLVLSPAVVAGSGVINIEGRSSVKEKPNN